MNLAIGIRFEDASSWSIGVEAKDPQQIADLLKDSQGYYPDEVLLVSNGEDCPDVSGHYSLGREYTDSLE